MAMTHEQWREHPCYKFDPFADEIQPALLHKAAIKMYVDEGCLVECKYFDDSRLKAASYEMKFLGKLYDWEMTIGGRLQRRCRNICCDDDITLYRNTIAYLWMKEKLLLPEYIAVRFNLHIRHVHKGILLGTGPLVDPGFFGNLLIPLHNLTDNDYQLKGGDGLIWVEFTKVSGYASSDLESFPSNKDITDSEEYMKKSTILKHGGVQSAFKGALEKAQGSAKTAQGSAETARKETERFRKIYTVGGIVSVIVAAIALASMIIGGYSLVTQVFKITDDVRHQTKLDGDKQSQKIDSVKNDIADLEARIARYKDEVSDLKEQVNLMKERQEAGRKIVQ